MPEPPDQIDDVSPPAPPYYAWYGGFEGACFLAGRGFISGLPGMVLLLARVIFLATTVSKGAGIWTADQLWNFGVWVRDGALSAGVGGAFGGGLVGAVLGVWYGPPPWAMRR